MSYEERVDELYSLPLSEFTERRNALAKELKDSGDKEAAVLVKKLAKPTLAAWAVNQLARREPEAMQELIAVQDRLASASSAKDLRDLTKERRELITRLKRAAGSILEGDGHGAGSTTLQQVSQSLLAGATEEEQQLLLQGRLTRDLSSSGLEQVWGLEPATTGDAEDDEAADDAAERRARQEAEDLTRRAAEAQQRAGSLEADVDRLQAALEEARTKATRARTEAEELEDRAAAARRAAGLEG